MPNKQSINELVSESAFQQLDKLEDKLVLNKRALVDSAKAAKQFIDAIGGAKNLKDFSASVENASKGNTRLAESAEKVRLAEIRLEMQRRKAFDDFEKRMQRQLAAEQKASIQNQQRVDKEIQNEIKREAAKVKSDQKQIESDTRLRNARIANIDNYNRRLAQQQAAQEKATLAQMKAAEAARAANLPYNRMNTELGVLRTRARDIGVEFGINSRQFRDAAAGVNVLDQRLRSVDQALGQSQRNVGNYASAFQNLGSQVAGIAAQYLSFYAVIGGIRALIRNNSEISDSLAEVQRTAALTSKEAENLANSLKKIDTRTSLKGLLAIATIGGQLGIAKDQLAGFTAVVDELSVVLSNEIPGGAEAVASSLGKINGVFQVQKREGTDTEQSLRKTGSAILALGQAGLATGEYLQDFTLRTAGIAQTAKISLPTILAYSAVLEETGSSAEVAGTAFNRLVGNLASKREQFFAIAKIGDATLTLKEFTDLINRDANAALQKFFVGLNKGGANLTSFTDLLTTLKIQGGPAKNAIVALAQNQELLNTRVQQSNEAYKDGTLAAEQFRIKNNTLAGSLDKLGNAIVNITTNPDSDLAGYFKFIVDAAADAIYAIEKFGNRLRNLNDKYILSKVRNGDSGRGLFADDARVREALDRANFTAKESLTDNLTGKAISNAQRIAASIKTQADFTRILANENKRLQDDAKRFNYNQAFIKDTKNVGAAYDAQVAKANKLRVTLFTQNETVKELTKTYTMLYGAFEAPTTPPVTPPKKGKNIKTNDPVTDAISANKRLVESVIQSSKEIVNNEKGEYNERLQSLEVFTSASEQLVRLDGDKDLRNKKLTAKGREAVEIDVQNRVSKIRQDAVTKAFEIELQERARLMELRSVRYQSELNTINEEEAFKFDLLNESFAKRTISETQFGELRTKIQREYTQKYIQREIEQAQELLDVITLSDKDRADAEKKLADLKLKLSREITKNQIEDNKKVTDKEAENAEKRKKIEEDLAKVKSELSKEVADLAISLVNSTFERQSNSVKDEITLIDEKKQKDIEDVNDSVLTEQEKADRIAIIEATSAAKREQAERKLQEIEVRKAKFQKAASIAEVAVNTAKDVAKVTTGAAALSIIPIVGPALAAAALAQVPFMIGIGAAQIAAILATPIPKFEHGGVMRQNGLAMYGEVGTELMIDPSGKLSLTPDTPTVGHVKAGTEFISNKDLVRMLSLPDQTVNVNGKDLDLTPLLVGQEKQTKELKKIMGKTSHSTNITRHGWMNTQHQMDRLASYKMRNFE